MIGTPGTWSWYGLKIPDFQFTEALGMGKGQNWQNPLVPFAKAAEPQVQGATNQLPQLTGSTGAKPTTNFGQLGNQPTGGNVPPSGGGGGGGTPGGLDLSNPVKRTEYARNQGFDSWENYLASVQQPQPQQQTIDYDALIAPALQALDEAVTPAQSEYGANVASVEASRQKGKGQLQASLSEAQTAAGSQKEQLTGQTESAIDEARRQFAEIQQGLQSRYGKTTGTGGFASTYLGGETLRGISQKRAALTTAIQTIDDRLSQVKSVTDIALQDLEQQAEAQKLQVKSQLDNALQQIRTAKGQLLSQKAQLAQQAMQFYQQQVAQVNASNSAFKQQLLRDQMAAEQQLALAKQKAGSEIQKFSAITVGNADTGYVGAAFQPRTGEFSNVTPLAGGGALDQSQYTEEDELKRRLQNLNR